MVLSSECTSPMLLYSKKNCGRNASKHNPPHQAQTQPCTLLLFANSHACVFRQGVGLTCVWTLSLPTYYESLDHFYKFVFSKTFWKMDDGFLCLNLYQVKSLRLLDTLLSKNRSFCGVKTNLIIFSWNCRDLEENTTSPEMHPFTVNRVLRLSNLAFVWQSRP